MTTRQDNQYFIGELRRLGDAELLAPPDTDFEGAAVGVWGWAAAAEFGRMCDELDRTVKTANEELVRRLLVRNECLRILDGLDQVGIFRLALRTSLLAELRAKLSL